MPIGWLIDKRDTLEVVRDAVLRILLTELAGQRALAAAAGRSPAPWALRVFADRARPWPQFLEHPEQLEAQPVVNVLVDTTEVHESASDTVHAQSRALTVYVDCYGYGLTRADGQGGHIAGDRLAALESQRAARLCRNILMAGTFTRLGLTGLVWSRMVRSVEAFSPALESTRASQNVQGVRLVLEVVLGETSPQAVPEAIEAIRVQVDEATSQATLLTTEWPVTPYPLPPQPPWVEPVIESVAIDKLIDAPDAFERVRAQVASILAVETESQQARAAADGRDPRSWTLRVFEERTDPWAAFLEAPSDPRPVVNVRLASCVVDASASDTVARQVYLGRYTVDIYSSAQSAQSGADHVVGDELAARRAQLGARMARNILMASEYALLGLRGVVGSRMVVSTAAYRPEPDPLQNVAIIRLDLEVRFAELSPQVTPVPLEGLVLDVYRAPSGELLMSLPYPVQARAIGTFPLTLTTRAPFDALGTFPLVLSG